MPVTYPGNGTIPSTTSGAGRIVPIQAVTETGSGLVVQATGHGFNEGDTVEIEQGGAADGVYTIHVQDANDFLLNDTIGVVYASGAVGYCIDYQVLPAVSLPANGSDLVDATVAGAVWEAEQNFQPWMYRVAGKYRLYDAYGMANPNAPTAQPWQTGASYPAQSWGVSAPLGSGGGAIGGSGIFYFINTTGGADQSVMTLDFLKNGSATTFGPIIQANDVIEFTYSLSVVGTGNGRVLVFPTYKTAGHATQTLFQFGRMYDFFAGSPGAAANFKLQALMPPAAGGQAGVQIGVALQADLATGTSGTMFAFGPAYATVKHYRAN